VLLDDQDRWDIARRLLRDDSLKSEDRLAGLLVLLYAQHTTVISRMTIDQIQAGGDTVRLSLGRVPVQLPEPAATLARTVAANRLTQRLEALGIRSRRTRSAALFQLATEIPPLSSPAPSESAPTSPSPGSGCRLATLPISAAGHPGRNPFRHVTKHPRHHDLRHQLPGLRPATTRPRPAAHRAQAQILLQCVQGEGLPGPAALR
jgi:hypothetical protein